MDKSFKLNDNVIMKKAHACGENLWTILILLLLLSSCGMGTPCGNN